ncbi:MAG TPA: hypothetical protein IGQ44_04715 [Geminocystis sp. M7585_C2015_104]|nr:hypothetical protein [Geminocystis sp. M7585_C2015_104]
MESPSQFIENWCLEKHTLLAMAKNYKNKLV